MPCASFSRTALACALVALLGSACASSGRGVERVVVPDLGRLPTFSHAAVAGDLVFVSGTLGTAGGGVEIVPGGVAAETSQAIRNVELILAATGATLQDVAKCNVYLVDLQDFGAMNEAWRKAFGSEPPARTTVAVKDLVLEARVEVECVARRRRA